MLAHDWNPNYSQIQVSPRKVSETLSQKKKNKKQNQKGWDHSTSGKVLAQQA
jgi:hypothetical protein